MIEKAGGREHDAREIQEQQTSACLFRMLRRSNGEAIIEFAISCNILMPMLFWNHPIAERPAHSQEASRSRMPPGPPSPKAQL